MVVEVIVFRNLFENKSCNGGKQRILKHKNKKFSKLHSLTRVTHRTRQTNIAAIASQPIKLSKASDVAGFPNENLIFLIEN